MIFPIGNQRVGIVTDVPVLDGGDPVVSEFGEPVYEDDPMVVWVDGCLFESQTPSEQQNLTITTSDVAWAFMPVAEGQVPAVTDAGASAPVAVTSITSSVKLRHDGRTYVMRGDAVLEKDIHGREDHVLCLCERERG